MSQKSWLFLAWNAFILIITILFSYFSTRDIAYHATTITIRDNIRHLQINSPDSTAATIEIVSSEFFAFYKPSGETITGTPSKPPIGWTGEKYFHSGPSKQPGGKWLLATDYGVTISITSETPIEVIAIHKNPIEAVFSVVMVTLLFWLLGLIFLI